MTKEEYEKTRPANEMKLEFDNFIVRAYVDDKGELHVLAHRKSTDGFEQLPLAYLLGSNALIMQAKRG